jgi:hypothetical protein
MSFTADVHRIAEKIGVNAATLAEASVIELFSSVIKDTPVDTGRLRGNWQTTENSPASGTLDRVEPEGDGGPAIFEVLQNVNDTGLFYLTNNLPYAATVEFDRHSEIKAPKGMVRINAKRIKRIVRKEARKLSR